MTHIYLSKLSSIGSYNGLSPGRHQTIIWTNINIVNWAQKNKFKKIFIVIYTFLFKKIQFKMSGKLRPSRLGLSVLRRESQYSNTTSYCIILRKEWRRS